MAIHCKCLFIFGVVFLCLSCNQEASVLDSGPKDAGSFTLQATPPCIRSYGGGGGIFVLSMTPSEDFAGNVLLSVAAASALHAQLSPEVLTLDNRVAEVTLRPDTTVALGDFPIRVIAAHSDVSDMLTLDVKIVYVELLAREYALSLQDEFVSWLQAEHPDLGIEMGQDWFGYGPYPGLIGGGYWTFLNSNWEMSLTWVVTSSTCVWLLLREMGEAEPTFAAKREPDGTIHEVPVSEITLPGEWWCGEWEHAK